MKTPRLHNYEIVKNTLEFYKDRYLRKIEVSHLCGLTVDQVSLVIKAAWKLGWVTRIETKINNNNFRNGKYKSIRTSYKIKRIESWSGIMPLYHQTLKKDRLVLNKKNPSSKKS